MEHLREKIFYNPLLADEVCKNIPFLDLLKMEQVSTEFCSAYCSHVSGFQKLDLHDVEKVCKLNLKLIHIFIICSIR